MMNSVRHIKTGLFAAIFAFSAGNAVATDVAGKALDMSLPHNSISADVRLDVKTELYAQRGERKISASQAKSIAMNRVRDAKFVNVQMVGGNTYRVRLQKNGRIIDVYVDARTGAVK